MKYGANVADQVSIRKLAEKGLDAEQISQTLLIKKEAVEKFMPKPEKENKTEPKPKAKPKAKAKASTKKAAKESGDKVEVTTSDNEE